jgi:hypothetical protein
MTRTLKSLIAAALIASSATVAFASDNGDGAATLEGIRNTQRGVVTAPANGFVPFAYAGAATQTFSVDPAGPNNGSSK